MSIMRQPLLPTVPEKMPRPEITETDDEIAKSIQIVVNKLLDCTETSECTNEERHGSTDLPLEQVKDVPAKKRKPAHELKNVWTNSGTIRNGSDEEPPPKAKLVEAILQDSQPKKLKRKRKQSFVVLKDDSMSDTLIVASSTQPASENTEVQDENTEAVVHENLRENKKIMSCRRLRLQPKKLRSDSTHDDILNIQQVLWASIPSVTLACKWRVIYMNLGFAYLSLSRNSNTIKYNDIMKAVKLAQTEKITVVLKSKELQKNYTHRNFGIYCAHNYLDKIFVGPYFLYENHDLATLSFVNGLLVNKNLFNRIKGRNVPYSGLWFHQVTMSEDIIIQDPLEIIDLTCDSDDELLGEVAKPSSPNQPILLEHMLNLKQNNNRKDIAKAEKVLDALNKTIVSNVVDTSHSQLIPTVNTTACELANNLVNGGIQCNSECDNGNKMVVDKANKSDLNLKKQLLSDETAIGKKCVVYNGDESKLKYIVTNVPGMGYIVAYHYENYVDLICPITQKKRRFPSAKIAVTAVESVLSKCLTLIPATFTLQCRLVERIEDNIGPLNRSILNGSHIVGAFGIKNIFACTEFELKALGMEKIQITQTLLDREQILLLPSITQLAKLLKIPLTAGPLSECLSNILGSTLQEIEILRKQRNSFANEKLGLKTKKSLLIEHCSKLIAVLPPEEQSKVQGKLDEILNFNSEKESEATLKDIPGKEKRRASTSVARISNLASKKYRVQVKPKNVFKNVPCTVTAANTNSIATSCISSASTISKEHVNLVQSIHLPSTSVSPKLGNVNISSMTRLKPVPTSTVTSSTFTKTSSNSI